MKIFVRQCLGGFLFAALSLVSFMESSLAGDAPISGPAYARDGDGVYIGDVAFRLWGIDAPELDQTCRAANGAIVACGEVSRAALEGIIDGQNVICHPRGMTYDRILALCALPDGTDLSAAMTRLGYVFAYREYSLDYVKLEEMARIEGRYLWQLETPAPSAWRDLSKAEKHAYWNSPFAAAGARSGGLVDPTGTTLPRGGLASATPDCRIKGNVNAAGRRLYHRPGDGWYERTKIDTSKGEAWFCSEADARAAGFVPAGRK
ncbi:MAG: thermonuclease family protein [Vicinamibacterales bacterium]